MYGGFTDPWSLSYDPVLAQKSGKRFSTFVRDMALIRQALLPVLAQLAMCCCNQLSNRYVKYLSFESHRFRLSASFIQGS